MGSGFSNMKKQAKQLQDQLGRLQEQLKQTEVTASAGNGLVTVTLTGEKALKHIAIKPECVNPNDVEGLQDLILAAFQEAFHQIEANQQNVKLPW